MEAAWRSLAPEQDWLDGVVSPIGDQQSRNSKGENFLSGPTPDVVRTTHVDLPEPDLQWRDNGIDFHVDWGASQLVSKNVHVGLAGYYFQQLTADSGAGAKLGDFKGRVAGIGPQIGFMFPLAQGYLNVKGYKDFAAENRPEGWTAWLTLLISPAAPEPAVSKPMIRK
jgi:hypothetical protein